jgi:hypothetical protein
MKKILIAFFALVSVSAFGLADIQSVSTQPTSSSTDVIAQGFRVNVVKSFLTGKISAGGYTFSGEVKQSFGLGLGYADIRPRDIGWIADAQYDSLEPRSSVVRIDGDITYGFDRIGYLFGGINVSRVNGVNNATVTPGLGIQFGIGANITKSVGADLGYVMWNNSLQGSGNQTAELTISGLELKVHATF